MSLIVATLDDRGCHLVADSQATSGNHVEDITPPKIRTLHGGLVGGFTGPVLAGEVLELTGEALASKPLVRRLDVVQELRASFDQVGWLPGEEEGPGHGNVPNYNASFLVTDGYTIFEVDGGLGVVERRFAAIGLGYEYAFGVLHAVTRAFSDRMRESSRELAELAVGAAIEHHAYVGGPPLYRFVPRPKVGRLRTT